MATLSLGFHSYSTTGQLGLHYSCLTILREGETKPLGFFDATADEKVYQSMSMFMSLCVSVWVSP